MDASIIIVLYNPSYRDIKQLVIRIGGYDIVLVDNSDSKQDDFSEAMFPANVTYIDNKGNLGIAAAQNRGIEMAREKHPAYLLFFDQDSRVEQPFVDALIGEFKRLQETNKQLAVLGPSAYNEQSGEEYASVLYSSQPDANDFIPKPNIISSGSCMRSDIFDTVGLFDEALFIDNVDTEFCWRVTAKGYLIGITTRIRMAHNIGQRELRFGKYRVIISAPFRYYYQYRNYLWLSRRSYAPMRWKVNNGIKFFLRMLYFPFVLRNGLQIERAIFRGIYAGLFKGNRHA